MRPPQQHRSAVLISAPPSPVRVARAAGTGTHDAPEERYVDRLFRWVNETFPHPEHRCDTLRNGHTDAR